MTAMETVAEYAELDPRPLRDFDEITAGRRPETYFRCGYVVDKGAPLMVDQYVRTREAAEEKARVKAGIVRGQLQKLGAPADVSWWVQEWRTENTVTLSLPVVERAS